MTTPATVETECSACAGDECADLTCPKSQRPCGHHCNCVMIHDHCHWCGQEWGDEDHVGRVRQVVQSVSLGVGHAFRVDQHPSTDVVFVQHSYECTDIETGLLGWGGGRKWHISEHATDSEIVLTCLLAALTNAEHEIRERFTYNGQPIVHPHPSLAALLSVAAESEVR